MSFLKTALELAGQGFYVFPLRPNDKLPLIENFTEEATKDPEKIKKFWTRRGIEMPYNIGISTQKYNGNQALVVVDLDVKKGKNGIKELQILKRKGFEVKPTLITKTPSGGMHLIYKTSKPVKQGANVLGLGIDIRSKGGYVVAQGSILDGKKYESTFAPVADCPEWIIEKCGTETEMDLPKKDKTFLEILDKNYAIERAKYFIDHAPLAVEGMGGDETTFKVAATLKDLGLDEIDTFQLMREWNVKCEPPWSEQDLYQKVKNAFEYGRNEQGFLAPENVFNKLDKSEDVVSYLDQINKEFALVFKGQKHFVLKENLKTNEIDFWSEFGFKRYFSPYKAPLGRGKEKSIADIWLDWPSRRQFEGVVFKPDDRYKSNAFNLWRGFMPSAPKDKTPSDKEGKRFIDMYLELLLEGLGGGKPEERDWVVNYFSHLIQMPYDRPRTTIVMKGNKGIGKNALCSPFKYLLGPHYVAVTDAKRILSNFNSVLESKLMVVLDEAFWINSRFFDSSLKALTTEPDIVIERKGFESYTIDNYARYIILGNEEWLVPASIDERRYCVFDFSNKYQNDETFFDEYNFLLKERHAYKALFEFLKGQKVDVSLCNKPLNNEGLAYQKTLSLNPFQRYWLECLKEGKILYSNCGEFWPERITKNEFRDAFNIYFNANKFKDYQFPNAEYISKQLKQLNPSICLDQKNKDGKREIRFSKLSITIIEFKKHTGIDVFEY